MRVICAGSRGVTDYQVVSTAITCTHLPIAELVSGGARGVDQLAEQYGAEHGIQVTRFPADWSTYGRAAGPIRNGQMADYADALIAIWDGSSRGTQDMINQMVLRGKPVYLLNLSKLL